MAKQSTFFPQCIERFISWSVAGKACILAAVGYACCRCASGLPYLLVESNDLGFVADIGKLLGMVIFVGVAFVFDTSHERFGVLVAPGLFALAGCLALLVVARVDSLPTESLALGVFLFGGGTAVLMLQWLEFISCISLKRIALVIGTAEILSSLFLMIARAIGSPGIASAALFVGLSLFCLLWFRRMSEMSLRPTLALAQRSLSNPRRLVSLRLVVWVSVYCFCYGLVNSFIDVSMFSFSDNLGNMLPGFAIVAIALLFPERFDIRSLKNIAFIFMVSGILFLGFFDADNAVIQLFAGAGAASCRLFAYSLACMRARMNHASALPACALVKCLIIVTMVLGSRVGALHLPVDGTLLVAGIIIVVSLLSAFLSPFNVDEQRVLDRATHSSAASKRAEVLAALSLEKGLSKRETTIFSLMAGGGDIAAISDELFISKSAVRAHSSRIYAKFGVHNRQEFDALLAQALPGEEE